MKKIRVTVALGALVIFLMKCTQPYTVSISSKSSDPEIVHESANDFQTAVGNYLKANYPSKVKNVSAALTIDTLGIYSINWAAEIEPADSMTADYYFDRKGTLMSGQTRTKAIEEADMEIQISSKVQIMMDQFDQVYGNHRIPKSFIVQSLASTPEKNEWWCLKEYFCAARK